jgi:acyl-homoserine lactone acylase PvdQ
LSDVIDQPWIRAYALTPRRLSEGGWVWLSSYEWRWQRPDSNLPSALNPPRVYSRRAPRRMRTVAESR